MELRELATKVFGERWVVVLWQRSLPWLDEPWTHSTHTPVQTGRRRSFAMELILNRKEQILYI